MRFAASSEGSRLTPKNDALSSLKISRRASAASIAAREWGSDADAKKHKTIYRPATVSKEKRGLASVRCLNHGAGSPAERETWDVIARRRIAVCRSPRGSQPRGFGASANFASDRGRRLPAHHQANEKP